MYFDERLLKFYQRTIEFKKQSFIMAEILSYTKNVSGINVDHRCSKDLQVYNAALSKSQFWALQSKLGY